jgi:hypothetical protein
MDESECEDPYCVHRPRAQQPEEPYASGGDMAPALANRHINLEGSRAVLRAIESEGDHATQEEAGEEELRHEGALLPKGG